MVYKNEDDSSDYWDGAIASEVEMVNGILSGNKTLDNYIWLEFTGLQDTNGKDIYEGDILEERIFKEVVKWNDKKGAWHLEELEDDMGDSLAWTNYEIIGDIHSNPDLLKDNK